MTTEELIQKVTAEVLRQLGRDPKSAVHAGPGGPKVLVLYTGGDQLLDEAVRVAGDLAAAGAWVRIVCTPAAEAIMGPERLRRLGDAGEVLQQPDYLEVFRAVDWAEVVVVPVLSQNTAVKTALGIRDSLATNLLAAAILMGRKIFVCPSSAVPCNGPASYRAMLNSYIDQLRTFGIVTVPVGEMVRACLAPAAASEFAAAQVSASVQPPAPACGSGEPQDAAAPGSGPAPAKRLVTAADVEEAAREGRQELYVTATAIVTPLARDLCRLHHVTLVYTEESGTGEVS